LSCGETDASKLLTAANLRHSNLRSIWSLAALASNCGNNWSLRQLRQLRSGWQLLQLRSTTGHLRHWLAKKATALNNWSLAATAATCGNCDSLAATAATCGNCAHFGALALEVFGALALEVAASHLQPTGCFLGGATTLWSAA
jgi:hypothetical protein